MIYKTIDDAYQLRDEFIQYDRDYFSIYEYEALFEYYSNLDEGFELDVIAICCSVKTKEWEDLFEEFDSQDQEYILEKLNLKTYVLHSDDSSVLYLQY